MTQCPSRNLSAPCSTICSRAEEPLERSIAMARIAMSPQPTNGSQRSSFFTIQHCEGNALSIQIVSHADWCFDMITTGVFGTCSQPETS